MWRSLACRHVRGTSDFLVEWPERPISSSISGSLNEVRMPKQWRTICIVNVAEFDSTIFGKRFAYDKLQSTMTLFVTCEHIDKINVKRMEIK